MVEAAINKAVAYLSAKQRPDGSFDSYSSPSKRRFKKTFRYQTTFTPALILTALSQVDTPATAKLKQRLAGFVKAQAGPSRSFNYWSKSSPERRRQPYPDDLDDTCCALAGLALYDSALVGADVLAAFVKLLLAVETQVGGPYRTWLVPPDSPAVWLDVDLAVNANIAYFLSLVGEPLPNLTGFMEQAISSGKLASPYYVSAYPLLYYLARAYRGSLSNRLLALAQRLRASEKNLTPLKTALLLSSLSRLGENGLKPLITGLLATQRPDGHWPAEAFCLDPARGGRKYYSGSESLTTALAAEALWLSRPGPRRPAVPSDSVTADFRRRVLAGAERDCRNLEPGLADAVLGFLNKLADSSIGPEIISLPQAFGRSLKTPASRPPISVLARLSLANLYGWAAYTIIDDFLDEEGQADLLPIAAFALRRSHDGFSDVLPADDKFRRTVWQTFDAIDSANAWELAHCRARRQGQLLVIDKLPDYGDLSKLAERSLGHGLAPLAILRLAGTDFRNPLFARVRQAFKHYLIARQLNDDLHDWQTDLRNGHLTYVVTKVLSDAGIDHGNHAQRRLLPLAQRQFWYGSLAAICQTVRRQTVLSRDNLQALPLNQPNVINGLLDKIDASVDEALTTKDQAIIFLEQYKR